MDNPQTPHDESVDDLLRILANEHCRATLWYFRDASDDVTSVRELAAEIRKRDHGRTEQIASKLHHSVLPRLADIGVVEYDPQSNTVRYNGHSELEALLDGITAAVPEGG